MIDCKKCNEEIEDSDMLMVCTKCGAIYHKDCWFSEPICIVENCKNSRGMPLRGENIDPNMTDGYIADLLKEVDPRTKFWNKYYPLVIAFVIFVLWIGVNSYIDYKNHQTNPNTVIFKDK